MIEIIMKWLLFLFIGLGLAQRLCWWLGKRYFPFGWRTCQWVHDKKSCWWKKVGELLTHKPKNITVIGFFSTLVCPFFIILNLLLLAYLFEGFFPGSTRIVFPWGESYATFPLIAGFLYTIAQVQFLIFREYSNSKVEKVGFITMFFLTVIIEIGLSAHRAWTLDIYGCTISHTIWDSIMKRGVILGGLLGFLIPTTGVGVATISSMYFIRPMIRASLHWLGGLVVLLWCIVTWWICGFYYRNLPENSRDKMKDLRERQ